MFYQGSGSTFPSLPSKTQSQMDASSPTASICHLGIWTEHISPWWLDLFGLSVCFQVQFKALALTFKALGSLEPSDLHSHYIPLEHSYPSQQPRAMLPRTKVWWITTKDGPSHGTTLVGFFFSAVNLLLSVLRLWLINLIGLPVS